MNRWGQMLDELSPTAQRVIARRYRISLPHTCSGQERRQRMRRAMCRQATVRTTFAQLEAPVQVALRELAACRGGLALPVLTARYGSVRSWMALCHDPKPQSISETLICLGWLILRPATPRHPAHALVPYDLRRWLPRLANLPMLGIAPIGPVPLVLRAVPTLILAASAQPLACRQDGQLTTATLRPAHATACTV